jgi:hypothetical protein
MPGLAWSAILLFVLPHVAGDDICMLPCPAIGQDGVLQTFAQAGLEPQSSQSQAPT